jgi:hypothetical protein
MGEKVRKCFVEELKLGLSIKKWERMSQSFFFLFFVEWG